jgi:serine/threonine-protein kinase
MGEVYRARDTKLKRDVALKVLPEAFAKDPGRMLRFQREAEVLASLNHPNIAHIYGVEDRALVMELVEGEPPKGPLPFDDAWKIALQIADALEYAHEKGVIHRDLKPANVKVTPDGVVKLLDFGLAKAFSETPDAGSVDPENSPTITLGATVAGTVLGTAAYMSPEQAKGKKVDKRADIWAWGVVLYELLTGERLFKGDDATDTLAQVLTKEPPLERVPPQVRRLLGSCLQKDPKHRLRDIGDAKRLLAEETVTAPSRPQLGWAAAVMFAVLAAGLGLALWRATRPVEHSLVRLDVDLGLEISLPTPSNRGTEVIISPDGTRIVYRASVSGGQPRLFTRRLDQPKAMELPGTEGAVTPFFSPDGLWIGFSTAPNRLNKISVEGGAVVSLGNISLGSGASWGEDGAIIGAINTAGTVLFRVPPGGGSEERLTELSGGEVVHGFPQILPGGKAILFVAYSPGAGNIEVLTLADRRRKVLVQGTSPRYLPSGHLIYVNESTLFAVPFDLDRLATRGTPIPILNDVAHNEFQSKAAQFDVSASGTLVYRRAVGGGTNPLVTLQWLDSTGRREALPAKAGSYNVLRLSPDGMLVALMDPDDGSLQVYDRKRDTLTRVGQVGPQGASIWTPDGRYILFTSVGGGISWTRWDRPGEAQPFTSTKNPVGSKNSIKLNRRGILVAPDETKQMDTPARVRYWPHQPGTARPERVFGCRESSFARTLTNPIAFVRSGKIHLGRDWQTTRAQGPGPSGVRRQTRYHSGVVSQADCP